MRGLPSLALRNLSRRKARYALTALGIVLGVGNVFGVLVTNSSTNAAVERNAAGFVGRGDVSVTPRADDQPEPTGTKPVPFSRQPSISPSYADKIRALPGVSAVGRHSVGWLAVNRRREMHRVRFDERLTTVSGVDLEVARRASTLVDGRWYKVGRPEIVVEQGMARRLRLELGDRIPAPGKKPSAEIVGIMTNRGEWQAHSVTSVEYMSILAGYDGLAVVQVYLEDSVEPDVWAVTYEPRFRDVEFLASGIPREFQRFLTVVQATLGGAAAIAIFVGAFLIYLTFTMAIVERTRMYGTLHAVGATSAQVRRLVLVEALAVGAAATLAGLALGVALALGLIRILSRALDIGAVPLEITPLAIGTALGIGLLATVVGAFAPALRASRLSPVEAIRVTPAIAGAPSRSWIAGVAAIGAGFATHLLTARSSDPLPGAIGGLPVLLILLGGVLIVPPLLPPIVRAARALITRIAPLLGDVATMHIVRERSRSAYTLGLLMVVLAMMLALGTAHASIGRALNDWVRTRFGADVLAYQEGLTPRAIERVARVDGVAGATPISFGRTQVVSPRSAGVQNVVAIDERTFFDIAGFPWSTGSTDDARDALTRGGAAFLPASTAARHDIDVGDTIIVGTSHGNRELELVATYASIAAGPEVGIVVGRRDGQRLFGLDRANVVYVDFDGEPQTPRGPTRGITRVEFGGQTQALGPRAIAIKEVLDEDAFVIEGAQIKQQGERQLSTYFALFLAVLVISVVVGLLGLANTMTTSVMQRFREIGTLQAVGAAPKDVRRMVLAEVAALVLGAAVLSIAVGIAVSYVFIRSTSVLLGFSVTMVYPWQWLPIVALLAIAVAIAAAIAPSRRAERLTPVEALRYE